MTGFYRSVRAPLKEQEVVFRSSVVSALLQTTFFSVNFSLACRFCSLVEVSSIGETHCAYSCMTCAVEKITLAVYRAVKSASTSALQNNCISRQCSQSAA